MSKTSLPKYVVLHKKRGETPLELLNSWKFENAEKYPGIQNVQLSYAGRLDPMAEGKLLVLVGDECKRQSHYTKLDKEYEIEILLDLKTDTGDVLGMAQMSDMAKMSHMPEIAKTSQAKNQNGKITQPSNVAVAKALKRELGPHSRLYPVFSSKTVHGKPLFLYALEGTIDTITIPQHIETVYKINNLGSRQVTSFELKNEIERSLAVVPRSDEQSKLLGADFRQDAVREKWREIFSKFPASSAPISPSISQPSMHSHSFTILRLRVTCGSGAYMRTLAERIGISLGTSALALSINRTKIGKYVQLGPIGFWLREF